METTTIAKAPVTAQPSSEPKAKGRGRGRPGATPSHEASREAKRVAAGILEVLAGLRTPTEAATGLGVSIVRYYILEARALAGLVTACEPRVKGPGSNPAREVNRLRQQIQHLEREVQRHQALARASQRAVGLTAVPVPKAPAKTGQKHRRRKPVVRALRAAAQLRAGPEAPPVTPPANPGT